MADLFAATLVSATSSVNASSNPIYVQLTDGTDTSLIDGSGNLNVILAANSGTDIGDVDVLSVIPGVGATNLGKAEDAVHSSGDTGVQILAVRNDTLAALAGTDGDYAPIQVNADGAVYVTGSFSADNVLVDDAAFTVGTSSVGAVGMLADETTPDSVDEGDIGIPRMTLDRKQLNVLVDATTDSQRLGIDASGNAQVIVNAELPTGTNNIGDVDVLTVPAPLSTTGGGTEATALRVTIANDSTGLVSVDDNGSSITIDNSTLAVVGGGTEATALRVTIANDSTGVLSVDDNGSTITVDSPTHDLFNVNANVQVGDSDVSTSNPIPVTIVDPGTTSSEINDYDTQAALAGSGTDNHDYTVANATFLLRSVIMASSGASKVEVQVGPVASLATKAVGFIPKQGGVIQLDFNPAIEVPVASTGTVRLIRTNREGGAQDVYSTIIGNDI